MENPETEKMDAKTQEKTEKEKTDVKAKQRKMTHWKHHRRTRRLFSATAATSSYGNNLSQPFIPFYLTRLGATVQQLGIFQAFQNLFPNILQLLWGYVSDRVRKRLPFVIMGTMAGSLILISLVFFSNVTALIIILSISALLASMGAPAWSALMGDKIRHKNRGRHFSSIANYSLMAGMLGGITTFFIFYGRPDDDIAPYKWLFIAGGLIGIASLIFILPIKDKPQNGLAIKMVKPSELSGDFRYFLCARGTYNFFMSIGWPLFYATQAYVLGATNIQIALMAFIGIGATIAFQPLVGKMNDRIGPNWLITASMFLFIAVPVTYIFVTSMLQLYILSVVIGFSSATSNIAFSTYILDVSPPEVKAEYFAYHGLVCGVTGFAGSLLAGLLANYLYINLLWPLATALMALYVICALGRVASAFMFLKVKNPKKYPSTARQFGAAYYERIRSMWRRP